MIFGTPEPLIKYDAIMCLTCLKRLGKKTDAKLHPGHDVVYLGKDGEPLK